MTAAALLTVCAGLTCSIMETNVTYDVLYSESFVRALKIKIKASHARLDGFHEWFNMKSEETRMASLDAIDEHINMELMKIQEYIENATVGEEQVKQCYDDAFRATKRLAKYKLPLVVDCINTFTDYAKMTSNIISEYLQELADHKTQLQSIIPECNGNDDRMTCMLDRTNIFVWSANHADSNVVSIMEQSSRDYTDQHVTAMNCQLPILRQITTETDLIITQANHCIRNA